VITPQTWNLLIKKQIELDQLIVEKSPVDLRWVSRFNAERLKLALLVEVGEFANEIKSFKAWRKKPEID
jgi:dimeric dUTPase (all-alpha-NTP-PPase superfamily)